MQTAAPSIACCVRFHHGPNEIAHLKYSVLACLISSPPSSCTPLPFFNSSPPSPKESSLQTHGDAQPVYRRRSVTPVRVTGSYTLTDKLILSLDLVFTCHRNTILTCICIVLTLSSAPRPRQVTIHHPSNDTALLYVGLLSSCSCNCLSADLVSHSASRGRAQRPPRSLRLL
jgi:hypothetical protein